MGRTQCLTSQQRRRHASRGRWRRHLEWQRPQTGQSEEALVELSGLVRESEGQAQSEAEVVAEAVQRRRLLALAARVA